MTGATGRFLAESLPAAEVIVLPHAAYLVATEEPETVARAIIDQLRPLGRYDMEEPRG